MTLHVVGNLCLDTTWSVPRFPRAGETMVARAAGTGLGGKGVNQAVAAARAGATVVLHAALGDADATDAAVRLADEARLTLKLTRLEGPSDASIILVRPDGENVIVSTTACARQFAPASRPGWAAALEAGDVLLMQGNLSADATAACLTAARRRGVTTVLNPSPLWSEAAPVWREIDWLVLNGDELASLSGDADPDRGAAIMRGIGVAALAVTLGGRGAVVLDADGRAEVAAPGVVVRDTSGAGDVFCGVLVAHLTQGAGRGRSLACAVAAASLSVTRAGALASCPTADELAGLFAPYTDWNVG